jgi:dihydroflavonol-4-reductase
MKKILVTGATGFVGYHVARKLADRGEVLCLARPNSDRRFLSQLKVRIVEGDLRDPASLERALDGCDTLFHVAADYRLWSKDPNELVDSNVKGSENILSAARKAGVSKIVYTSSVSAVGRPEPHVPARGYGGLTGEARARWELQFTGNELLDPTHEQLIGPYKQSKYQGELVARRCALEGLPVVVVNPSTPIGSYDIKPTPTGKLVLDFLNRKMPAYLDTGLNLVDVDDVAEGHLLAAEKGKPGERYILGNRNLMLKEILDMLARITGLPAPKIRIPYWVAYASGAASTAFAELTGIPPAVPLDAVRMAREVMFYDAAKAVRTLGLPQQPIEGALEKAVRFFKDNGYVR